MPKKTLAPGAVMKALGGSTASPATTSPATASLATASPATVSPVASAALDHITGADSRESVHITVMLIAGLATTLCILVSARLIYKHLSHFSKPSQQRRICGILYLAPIFALDSFLSIGMKELSPGLETLKDIYEGYTIYLFFSLLVEYLGGDSRIVDHLANRRSELWRPFPLNKVFSAPYRLDERFFKSCKFGVLQFCIVRPLLAIVAAVCYLSGVYHRGDFSLGGAYLYIELLINASVTWAVWCLVVFFLALREPLSVYDPVPKFIAVKAVVFLCFWQSFVIAILARLGVIHAIGTWTTEEVAEGLSNLLICFEMLGAAVFHHRSFPWDIYDTGRTEIPTSINAHFALADVRRDIAQEMPPLPRPAGRIIAGAVGVVSAVGAAAAVATHTQPKKERFNEGAEPLLREEEAADESQPMGDRIL